MERYEYQDVRGTIRVDRGADPLFGEVPDAIEDLKRGVRQSPHALAQNLGGEVHQDGRSTMWIKGKYGNRLRVIVEVDEPGTLTQEIRSERGCIAAAPQMQEELAQEYKMRRDMQRRVDRTIAMLGRHIEQQEYETDEAARMIFEEAMQEAINILSNPKEAENVGG